MAPQSQATTEFTFERLQNAGAQIRLIRILPGADDDDIALDLFTVGLEHAPIYDAISYTWGEGTPRDILINGKAFAVLPNCYYTLWQVRRLERGRPIWNDAICIDQNSIEEKNQQVTIMGYIYDKASTVFACIGAHANGTEVLFRMAHEIEERSCIVRDEYSRYIRARELWTISLERTTPTELEVLRGALYDFHKRPYWSRL